SGCGKTTLLKSLNRLLDLQEGVRVEGKVLVDGEDIYDPKTDPTRLRKKMGLLSQRPQVLPMTIYENVVYGLRIHGEKNRTRLDTAVEKYLNEAHLWKEVKDRLHTSASRLSIGQQQRLCLARGLAVEPEIILGDEPTSALDPISAEQIEQRFLALKDQYTIILVTHVLRQAKRLADYVIFLYLGHLIEHGPADQVLNHPRYAKTKAYVEGKFIEEPAIDRELNLVGVKSRSVNCVHQILTAMSTGQVLKVLVGEKGEVENIIQSPELQNHNILEMRQLDQSSWEILIQKHAESYTI
ncbi:MAG: ATP-binding cassette domain-containing protein, partial [Candidatus Omnitrophica bacterium]|nr:ATP-binding cassette domain-containing protein [Candidatus Omnitrophota bacterium]